MKAILKSLRLKKADEAVSRQSRHTTEAQFL